MEKRIKVLRRVVVDTSKLYDTLDKAIRYLQEVKKLYPKAELNECWYGYEDMDLVFEYYEEETDAEYKERIEELKRKQKKAEEDKKRQEEKKRLLKQKAALEAKLERL